MCETKSDEVFDKKDNLHFKNRRHDKICQKISKIGLNYLNAQPISDGDSRFVLDSGYFKPRNSFR